MKISLSFYQLRAVIEHFSFSEKVCVSGLELMLKIITFNPPISTVLQGKWVNAMNSDLHEYLLSD